MKLRVKDRKRLDRILLELERGHDYLMSKDVLFCLYKSKVTTTLDMVNKQGDVCTPMNKEYGSLLCLLDTGIKSLKKALTEEE